jgi:general secretion pathway protein N
MVRWPKILGFALLSGGMLPVAGSIPAVWAATSATLDILPNDDPGAVPGAVDLGSLKPIPRPNPDAGQPVRSGNPLWAVPLSALTTTRERPIFSASRRPPQPAVIAPPPAPVQAPAPPRVAGPEHPPFTLVGAVVGDNDAIAVFVDLTNQQFVRLHQGDSHAGWELSSVLPREVTFKKADRTEVLVLKRQEGAAGVPGVPIAPAMPALVPGATGANSYAPFIPRSTPKHGESDGL